MGCVAWKVIDSGKVSHTVPALFVQNFIAQYTLYQYNWLTLVTKKIKHETMW